MAAELRKGGGEKQTGVFNLVVPGRPKKPLWFNLEICVQPGLTLWFKRRTASD